MYRRGTGDSHDSRKYSMNTTTKKVAFITGSTRGIGQTLAYEFAKLGYAVIVNGRQPSAATEQLIKDIKNISAESNIFYFDVGDTAQVEAGFKKILETYDRVDVLVNNAGIVKNKMFAKMDYADWDAVMKTNVYGMFSVTKNVLPLMIKNNCGRIINLSSVSAFIGDFGQTAYSASKAAILGFTRSLARETAKYNVTANVVYPGLVETEILKDVPQEYMDKLLKNIPLGRVAKKEEIAKLVLFLASEDSSYITGSLVNITGGWI